MSKTRGLHKERLGGVENESDGWERGGDSNERGTVPGEIKIDNQSA